MGAPPDFRNLFLLGPTLLGTFLWRRTDGNLVLAPFGSVPPLLPRSSPPYTHPTLNIDPFWQLFFGASQELTLRSQTLCRLFGAVFVQPQSRGLGGQSFGWQRSLDLSCHPCEVASRFALRCCSLSPVSSLERFWNLRVTCWPSTFAARHWSSVVIVSERSGRSEAGLFASSVSLCVSLCDQARELRCATRAPQGTVFFSTPTTAELASAGVECRAPASGPLRNPLVFLRPCVAVAVPGSRDLFITPDIIAT